MPWVLGTTLGVGLLLMLSPWLWPRVGRTAQQPALLAKARDELTLAGYPSVSLGVAAAVAVLIGAFAGFITYAAIGLPVLAVIAAAVGAGVLPFVVHGRATVRRDQNRAVWPDVVDHLVASVRAGMALPESVASLAEFGPPATRSAFAQFEVEYRRNGNFGASLDALKSRLADPNADRLLETLRMAREVGGTDLPQVLRGLASYLRDDQAVRGEVRARQSWVRNAARLGVIAPWALLLVLSTKRETVVAFSTPAGTSLIVVGFVLTLVAYRVMIAIGRLPGERRWFR
ncbi:MAG TPA: type II secretion system F family protein [Candidatus Lumbricidophila sp.]|nr:type II secretion system F family protein [Candidatus Lumbricidophila sp.]